MGKIEIERNYDDNGNLTSKTCTKCKEIKDVSEFYKDSRHSDGLKSNCKSCAKGNSKKSSERKTPEGKERWKERLKHMSDEEVNQHLLNNMIRITKGDTVLIKRCQGCMEYRIVEEFSKCKKWKDGLQMICKGCRGKRYEANPDYMKEYYENNKEAILNQRKEHYEANKEANKEAKTKQWKDKLKNMAGEEVNQFFIKNMIRIKKDGTVLIKRCTDCMEYKMVQEFSKDNSQKDGLRPTCKECNRKRSKEWKEAKIQQALEDIRLIVEANPTKYDYIPGMDIFGIIYLVYNRITKRYYVGQTTISFDIRYKDGFFHNHIDKRIDDERYNGPNQLLQQDLELYGEESFEFNKIFKVASNQYELDKIEAYYIDHFNSYEAGYNRNRGMIFTNRGLEE